MASTYNPWPTGINRNNYWEVRTYYSKKGEPYIGNHKGDDICAPRSKWSEVLKYQI